MAAQPNSSAVSNNGLAPNDAQQAADWKNALYGYWQRSVAWQDDLARKTSYRALDIPMSEGINASRVIDARNFSGLGWRELLVIGAMTAGGAWWMSGNPFQTENPSVQPPPAAQPSPDGIPPLSPNVPLEDREYQIIHRDKDGNIINVLPWPPGTGNSPASPPGQ